MTTLAEIADYTAAHEAAAIADESECGRILMRGADRAALLQRLSTNDIARLRPGQGAATVLTTPIGRIIDLLTVVALEDALLVLTSPGQGGVVWSHLKKNIFFNDKVTLEAAGRAQAQLALYGPSAPALLAELAGAPLPELALHHSAELPIAGQAVRAVRRAPIGGAGLTLLCPAEGAAALREALQGAGAAPLSPATLQLLQVEHGIPAFGRELSQEYIPLETGLDGAISFSKGCYVGQEIIARMESRGRRAKQLRGLRLSAPASAPAQLSADGREAGDLTSAALSPRLGPIALAYVRSAHAEPGSVVGIAGTEVTAVVTELPFV